MNEIERRNVPPLLREIEGLEPLTESEARTYQWFSENMNGEEIMSQALYLVNDLKRQVTEFAVAVDRALDDGKIDPWEGMGLGMKGMQLGSSIMMVLKSVPVEVRKEMLDVLQYAQFTLPDTSPMTDMSHIPGR